MSGMPVESLLNFVRTYADLGDEIAVRQRRGYRTESWTYGQIAEGANRLARELEGRGLAERDAVLLWGENSAKWIAAFLGGLLRGVIFCPMYPPSCMELSCR